MPQENLGQGRAIPGLEQHQPFQGLRCCLCSCSKLMEKGRRNTMRKLGWRTDWRDLSRQKAWRDLIKKSIDLKIVQVRHKVYAAVSVLELEASQATKH